MQLIQSQRKLLKSTALGLAICLPLFSSPVIAQSCGNLCDNNWWGTTYSGTINSTIRKTQYVNLSDDRGRTPLHYAAAYANSSAMYLLLEQGANPRAKTFENEITPLHFAAKKGNTWIVEPLLELGADVNALTSPFNSTPLHYAAMADAPESVAILIENGADVSRANNEGNTALHNLILYAENSQYSSYRLKALESLIEAGANVGAQNEVGDTPLHIALRLKNLDFASELLGLYPDLSLANDKGKTALHELLENSSIQRAEVGKFVSWLIAFGAKLDVADEDGNTPLHLAAQNSYPEVVDKLISVGADVKAKNELGRTAYDLAISNRFLAGSEVFEKL